MNEIDKFSVAVCGTDYLDAMAAIPAFTRKMSNEKLDGYNYNQYYDYWEEGDALLTARIKAHQATLG